MNNRFIVSRSFLKFLVTIHSGTVKIENASPLDAQSNISNTFAGAEEMIVQRYLRMKRITQNIYESVLEYYNERQWVITEANDESMEMHSQTGTAI